MNTLSPRTEAPDELDRLLSDFFTSQLKKPWPKVPHTPAAAAAPAEPSELVTTRTAGAPRNQPAPARRDHTARARFTLAASVALALGACWALSNGFTPGERCNDGPAPATNGESMLPGGRSSLSDGPFGKQFNKNGANKGTEKADPVKPLTDPFGDHKD